MHIFPLFFSRCQVSPSNPSCMEFMCEDIPCLIDTTTAEEIRRGHDAGQYTWIAATNSTGLWGHSLAKGLQEKLGTFKPEEPVSYRVSSSAPQHGGGLLHNVYVIGESPFPKCD